MVQVYNMSLRKMFINPKEKLKIEVNSKDAAHEKTALT
jgi:hypothetical protein